MNNVVVIDAGNSLIKARSAGGEWWFEHALQRLTEAEIEKVLQHNAAHGGELPPGYARVNGAPYAYGRTAERKGLATRQSGSARYTKDYYGTLLAIALGGLYVQSGSIVVFASHAPRDVGFSDDLVAAALGRYQVEIANHSGKRALNFEVAAATTFDEPVGGLMNVLLAEDGHHYARTDLTEGRTLVIDVGGLTTDFLAVNPGGDVDYGLAESIEAGIQQVERDFERSFRAANKEAVKKSTYLPPEQIRAAIRRGVLVGGGQEFPCADEVHEATTLILRRIAEAYQHVAGGPLPWHSVVLTGGGSAMLYEQLVGQVLDHRRVFLAENDEKAIHLANIRGGLKLWRLYEAEGVV